MPDTLRSSAFSGGVWLCLRCGVALATGLYPTDDLEAAKCDAVMDCSPDFMGKVRPSYYEKGEKKVKMGSTMQMSVTRFCLQCAVELLLQ